MLRTVALLCSTLLVGCTLIDQRTFNPTAGFPAKMPTTPGPPPIVPFLTIDLSTAHPDYAATLNQAVAEAVGRKPNVEFDVVSVVPGTGTPAQQVAAATGITGDAREIARAINADGVDDDRIHLSARADSAVTTRQVQIFVH
jgi:hypothetical protein